jgi:methyltransferase (TIGR00027 family)
MECHMTTTALIENVSDTAFWIAHHRSIETERPDALFHDPLARRLAGEHGRKIADAMPRSSMTAWAIVMRTCIIDDFIRLAISEGVDTVLNLGAGLDTRPYRLDLPRSVTWIESDYPHVIAYKEERLSSETPGCQLKRIACDLADAAARRNLLAEANASAKKLLILTEGLVPYWTNDDVAALADDLRKLDRAKYWLVDYFSPELIKQRQRQIGNRLRNAPFKFAPTDWFGFFEDHGWRQREVRYLLEEAQRHKRWIDLPLFAKILTVARQALMTKNQRETVQKFAGYILLEPDMRFVPKM